MRLPIYEDLAKPFYTPRFADGVGSVLRVFPLLEQHVVRVHALQKTNGYIDDVRNMEAEVEVEEVEVRLSLPRYSVN